MPQDGGHMAAGKTTKCSSTGTGVRKPPSSGCKMKPNPARESPPCPTPPSRAHSGPWRVGQMVEACDTAGSWYTAKIIAIEHFRMLIHFQRWSSRFDQWFDMDSALVRVKDDVKPCKVPVEYSLNEEVLAQWSNSMLYPARIIKVFNDKIYCNVLFYDGYKKKVKMSNLQKMPAEYSGDRYPPMPQTKEFSVIDPTNHNEFVCDTCKKGFRKQSLLLQHNKHYHNIDANMDGTSACSSVQSESSEAKPSESAGESVASQPALAAASTATDTATNVNGEKGKKVKSDKRRLTLETRPEGSPSQNKKVKLESASCASVESTPIYSYASTSAFYTNFAETKTFGKKAKPNLVLPFFDARQLADEHENDNIDETVKCICPVKEENGLMVQCELCLAWQHGLCMGFNVESDVPNDGYFCPFCRNPAKAHNSQRNSYQLNHWLKNSQEPVFLSSFFSTEELSVSNMALKNEPASIDMQINTGLFASAGLTEQQKAKKFTVHDLTTHSSKDEPHIDDQLNNLIDINLKSDIFDKILSDEDEAHLAQVKAINLLSAAMHNVVENLHSLDFKIHNHRHVAHQQIRDKQKQLKELLDLIVNKLEKVEKEIDMKESFAIHTSASTLTAASPENFGISDAHCGFSSMQKTPSGHFDAPNPASPGSPIIGGGPVAANSANPSSASGPFDTPTLSSMASLSNIDTTNSHFYNIPNKLLTSSVTSECHMPDSAMASTPSKNDQPTLARLLYSNPASVNLVDEQELFQNQRPSMSHDYLPSNLSDGEIKHEIAYHYKDLQKARDLVVIVE